MERLERKKANKVILLEERDRVYGDFTRRNRTIRISLNPIPDQWYKIKWIIKIELWIGTRARGSRPLVSHNAAHLIYILLQASLKGQISNRFWVTLLITFICFSSSSSWVLITSRVQLYQCDCRVAEWSLSLGSRWVVQCRASIPVSYRHQSSDVILVSSAHLIRGCLII